MTNKSKMLVVFLALAALPGAAAHSATWHVGNGDAAALTQTIASAQAGDTIIVGPGTYNTASGFSISKPLHIISEKGPSETIVANHCYCIGVGGSCYGSFGFYVYYRSPDRFTIRGFTIRDHFHCDDYGIEGWGVCIVEASGTVSNNIFTHNIYGVYATEAHDVVIENNLIETSNYDGISISSGESAEIRFNTFVRNFTNIRLGGSSALDVALQNNILVLADWWGMCVDGDSVTITLSCNDIWSNGRGDCTGSSASYVDAGGNISLDPLFCGGYYLHQDSPCLGVNTPALCNGDHMGCYPIACEVSTEKQSWGKIKSIFK
jgi:nitrous oxidase accessory protein NosD